MAATGFSDPVLAAQASFRAILEAMARPGRIEPVSAVPVPPAPLSPAAAAVALTLCDHDTPVWLGGALRASPPVGEWLRFYCGCALVNEPGEAAFAFAHGDDDLPAFDELNTGTADYPDRSTTLVLQVRTLSPEAGLTLTGPGIRGRGALAAAPLPRDFAARLTFNRGLFPRGIDLILAADNAVAALPRSVRVLESA